MELGRAVSWHIEDPAPQELGGEQIAPTDHQVGVAQRPGGGALPPGHDPQILTGLNPAGEGGAGLQAWASHRAGGHCATIGDINRKMSAWIWTL